MNRLFLTLFFVVLSLSLFSQRVYKNDRFYVLELGAGFSSDENSGSYVNEDGDVVDDGSGFFRARFVSGAFVHPNVSIGIGSGFEGNYGYLGKSTNPVYLDVRVYTKQKENFMSSIYLYLNYGKNIKWSNSFLAGDVFECGIGASCFSLGYNYRRPRIAGTPQSMSSITASIVFLFPL